MFEVPDDLPEVVWAASGRAEVRAATEAVYADLAAAVAQRGPRCDLSGRCCRFEDYGHSLFITTMELATFVHGHRSASPPVLPTAPWNGTGCPFQTGRLCGAHGIRPFGCRIYFCDPSSTDWQQDLYAHLHARLRRLHDALAVPYHYIEWRQALRALGVAGKPATASMTSPT